MHQGPGKSEILFIHCVASLKGKPRVDNSPVGDLHRESYRQKAEHRRGNDAPIRRQHHDISWEVPNIHKDMCPVVVIVR